MVVIRMISTMIWRTIPLGCPWCPWSRSSWPWSNDFMIFTIISLRWVLLRLPPTAAHCLGCTTSLPGQTPQIAAVLFPPNENLRLRISFQFMHILHISSGPTLQTAVLSLCMQSDPLRLKNLSFIEFFQSAFSHRQADLPSSWTEKISRRPQTNKNSLSCTAVSICAHMYFSIQLAIEKELQQSTCNNCKWNNKSTDIQTPQNILLQIRLPLSSLTYFWRHLCKGMVPFDTWKVKLHRLTPECCQMTCHGSLAWSYLKDQRAFQIRY